MLLLKLNVATFFPDCLLMTETSGPVMVMVGIAVLSVMESEAAELSV
jgi:hypothetical protein